MENRHYTSEFNHEKIEDDDGGKQGLEWCKCDLWRHIVISTLENVFSQILKAQYGIINSLLNLPDSYANKRLECVT